MDPATPQLEEWLKQILARDPTTFENAYWGPRPDPAIAIPRLLQLLKTAHDSYSRGKILELLGETGDHSLIPVISTELQHPDQDVRKWAHLALSALDQGTPWQQREWQ
jgi:hypothetical protein